MKKYLIIISISIAIGCNNRTEKTTDTVADSTSAKTENTDPKPADNSNVPLTGCYMQVLARDTFAAHLQQQGNNVTGRLSFDNYQKDGSTGTVNGKLENDILKLYYSFASEGMNSVMEVYFKQEEGKLLRGIGDMNNKGDTAYFTNPGAIKYNGSVLEKIPCDKLPAKYK
ncbi:MAG TPA: hypothetical protein VK489_15960 [Ferruginibacter sp.]|nr:hypothetical protein [Ferruginibacter sp.]